MSLPVIANHMATYGRNGDSMLVHMTPSEVAGLQSLAEKHGTSLTVNPHTGLPEAFSLKSLVPIAAGAMLGPAGFGLATSAMGAAAMVGGVTALASGNLKQGLMAGLGAYGGYGLGAGLAGMGAESLTQKAVEDEAAKTALSGTDLASDMATQKAAEASAAKATEEGLKMGVDGVVTGPGTPMPSSPIAADEGIKNMVQTTTQAPTFSQNFGNATAGFDRLTSPGGLDALNKQMAANSASAMGGPASAMGGLGYSTAGALGMDAMSQKNPAAGAKQHPGYIRPFNYDPYGQRYTAQTPVKADEWGSRSFNAADGGIVALAHGGAVPGYAAGGVSDEEIKAYVAANQNDPAAIAAAAQQYGVSTADLSRATGYTPEQVGSYFSNAGINFGAAPAAAQTVAPAAAAPVVAAPVAAPTPAVPVDINANINNWLQANPNATYQQMREAAASSGLSDAQILGAYDKFGYSAADRNVTMNKDWSNAKGMTGYQGLNDNINSWLEQYPEATKADALQAMLDSGLNNMDVLRATGKTLEQLFDEKKAVVPKTVTQMPGINNTPSVTGVSTTPRGDRTVNADDSITVHPNLPGGGNFEGMGEVKDVYTTGGGSLGYAPYAPKTAAEHAQFYDRQTGGSRAAFDYLMGSGAYPTVPSTPTGEIMKPYSEAVLGVPADNTRFAMRFNPVTRKYEANPDYKSFNFNQDTGQTTRGMNQEELAAFVADPENLKVPAVEAGKGFLGNLVQQLKDGLLDRPVWMAQNNISYEQLAAALGISVADAKKKYPVNKASDVPNTDTSADSNDGAGGDKNGGLMTLAGGGMASYDLGGYSDGGRLLKGPGDGVSDSIPASIGDKQPARLADGEFVVPARIVSELGNGSTDAGARKLYAMMDRVQKARGKTTGKGKVATNSRSDKYLPV